MELFSNNLKKLLIFQEGTDKPPKTNRKSAPKKLLVSFDVFAIFTAVKHREISCGYLYSAVNHTEILFDYLNVIYYEINESDRFSKLYQKASRKLKCSCAQENIRESIRSYSQRK